LITSRLLAHEPLLRLGDAAVGFADVLQRGVVNIGLDRRPTVAQSHSAERRAAPAVGQAERDKPKSLSSVEQPRREAAPLPRT
jgi:hypothetical protein